ncbi:MAG TPA: Uma2 family endonuclease [Candidatus Acidoferrales bacterium]|nr:Uma2 family endonuclease [Candidatus Acidoferrales bacterium]
MATKTLLTAREYATLEEPAGARYELSNGELIVTPSSSHVHNKIRDRLTARLDAFNDAAKLGEVTSETDVRLLGETVRRPDVAFIRGERLAGIDFEEVPLQVAPDLAIEIVSKNDRADDLMLKVNQYLEAGAQAVWLIYPNTRVAYRYIAGKREPEVRAVDSGDKFEEPALLPGFSIPLSEILR